MADTRKPPESPGGGPGRKRATPTIDLTATDVSDPPAEKAEAQPDAVAGGEPARETPDSAPETAAEPAPEAAAAEAPEEPFQPEPVVSPPPPRGGLGAGIAGGIVGALLVAAAAGGAWYAGYVPAASIEQQQLPARVAALQKQVQTLQQQPPPKMDTGALDSKIGALSQRVSKLEASLNNLPTTDKAAMQRVAALDDTVKSLSGKVASLGQRADTIAAAAGKAQQNAAAAQKAVGDLKQSVQNVAQTQDQTTSVSPGQLDALQQKLAALEPLQKKVSALETQIANARDNLTGEIKSVRGEVSNAQKDIAQATAGSRATRLALSATALRNAVLSGAPYPAQLAQAKSFATDSRTLAPLDRFAQSGVPSKNALADELRKLVPAMRKIAGAQKTGGSFLDRLQANAGRLISITPLKAPSGNEPADVLARVDIEAAHADLNGALADLARLPDNVRAPAKDWIAKVKARQAALAAAHRFSANAARALGKG